MQSLHRGGRPRHSGSRGSLLGDTVESLGLQKWDRQDSHSARLSGSAGVLQRLMPKQERFDFWGLHPRMRSTPPCAFWGEGAN